MPTTEVPVEIHSRPIGEKPRRVVIGLSGFGNDYEYLLPLAEQLWEDDATIFLTELPGCSHAARGQVPVKEYADWATRPFRSVAQKMQDAKIPLDTPVHIVGFSDGARAALYVLGNNLTELNVKSLVTVAGRARPLVHLKGWKLLVAKVAVWLFGLYKVLMLLDRSRVVGTKFGSWVREHVDSLPRNQMAAAAAASAQGLVEPGTLAAITIPVLVLYSATDDFAGRAESQEIYQSLSLQFQAGIHDFPGGHQLLDPVSEGVAGCIRSFWAEN